MGLFAFPEDIKLARETLEEAKSLMLTWYPQGYLEKVKILDQLIEECDWHRPLGPDGKHANRHTTTCGCEDKSNGLMVRIAESGHIFRHLDELAKLLDCTPGEAYCIALGEKPNYSGWTLEIVERLAKGDDGKTYGLIMTKPGEMEAGGRPIWVSVESTT